MLLVLIREVNFSSGSARSVWGRDLKMAGSIDLFSDHRKSESVGSLNHCY